MGILSMKASDVFVEVVRSQYDREQQMMAAQARKDGKPYWELVHRKNVVDASSYSNLPSFEEASDNWTFAFPFAAPILKKISDIPNRDKAYRVMHGINLARMADTLELLGKDEEAVELWQQAAKQMGHNDIQKARSIVADMTKLDSSQLEGESNLNKTTK